jgi:hypothetical protein
MNSSVYSADRATHLRILVVTLIASMALVSFALSARLGALEIAQSAKVEMAVKRPIVAGASAANRT